MLPPILTLFPFCFAFPQKDFRAVRGLTVHFCVTHGGVPIDHEAYGFRVMFILCHATTLLPLPGRVLTVLEASATFVRLRPRCKSGSNSRDDESICFRVVLVRRRSLVYLLVCVLQSTFCISSVSCALSVSLLLHSNSIFYECCLELIPLSWSPLFRIH
jgi:hypothetical protein